MVGRRRVWAGRSRRPWLVANRAFLRLLVQQHVVVRHLRPFLQVHPFGLLPFPRFQLFGLPPFPRVQPVGCPAPAPLSSRKREIWVVGRRRVWIRRSRKPWLVANRATLRLRGQEHGIVRHLRPNEFISSGCHLLPGLLGTYSTRDK